MDVLPGLDDPTPEAWDAWHREMLALRAGFGRYDDPATAWSDTSFRQVFLFMYDASFFRDGRYRTAELVAEWRRRFGRIDSVLLWHAYPRLGFDRRTQFDFYRDMPGGLSRLREDVTDVFQRHGIRVFVDYNPWDAGSYDELAEIVGALGADGVMLDTMPDLPEALERAVGNVVFAPERRPRDEDLKRVRQSWAQWFDIGEGPAIYRHQWLVPQHRQFAIRRWDTTRRRDIVFSFWCGSGLILWENVFGSWNAYPPDDRRLIAETAAVFDAYEDVFARGEWKPLVPTAIAGLDANVWSLDTRTVMTLRNRTSRALDYPTPEGYVALWPGPIAAGGVQALVRDDDVGRALDHFAALSARAGEPDAKAALRRISIPTATAADDALSALPGGTFTMVVRHPRRECGCYHEPWGWFYEDELTLRAEVAIEPLAMRVRPVTNGEYVAFVRATRYRPADGEHFLKHIVDLERQAGDPVTYVSLDDARAYARWRGQRLPTEEEWQWAAEGAGAGHRFPGGDDYVPGALTPQGIAELSGGHWELTESEYTDGHTRFVILRGGSALEPAASEWLPPRGPRPNDFHAKYILLGAGLDRSAAITFRTVTHRENCEVAQASRTIR